MIYYKHVVDMAHTYKKAIVKMPNGEAKEVEVRSWADRRLVIERRRTRGKLDLC